MHGRRSSGSRCGYARYPLFIHRLAHLLHASFRPRLAIVPLTATAGAVLHSVNIAVTVN
jgi:hypothetical protein